MHPTISTHTEKSYIPVVVGLMREWGQDPQDVPVCIDRHTPSSEDHLGWIRQGSSAVQPGRRRLFAQRGNGQEHGGRCQSCTGSEVSELHLPRGKTPMHGCAMSSSQRCPPQLHTEHVHLQKHVLAFCNATMTEF